MTSPENILASAVQVQTRVVHLRCACGGISKARLIQLTLDEDGRPAGRISITHPVKRSRPAKMPMACRDATRMMQLALTINDFVVSPPEVIPAPEGAPHD